MSGSIQHTLKKVRRDRVVMTYDVEDEGAQVKKELPFVVGVMAHLSGNPEKSLQPLKDRKFINIDRDNFNEVMQRLSPELNLRVANMVTGEGQDEMAVKLNFSSLDDFHPANVARQVKPLRELLETRDKLRDLLTKVDRSEKLEGILEQVLQNTKDMSQMSQALGVDAPKKPT